MECKEAQFARKPGPKIIARLLESLTCHHNLAFGSSSQYRECQK